MPQTLLIIGDVHGCLHTFRTLVETYWQPETMRLIQLGDLTDRGRFIPETIAFARELEEKHGEKTIFLKGNHESMVLGMWDAIRSASPDLAAGYARQNSTLLQYFKRPERLEHLLGDMQWLRERPLYWENDHVFVSHAGIAAMWENREEALQENNPENIHQHGRGGISSSGKLLEH
jgi:serine/threonine protein phosphatase 1